MKPYKEKVSVRLSDTLGENEGLYHDWTCVTWGDEDGDQSMTEIAVEDLCGIPLDIWVEGTHDGNKVAVRIEDVRKLIVTVQGGIERGDMLSFFKLAHDAIKLQAKLNPEE